MSSMDPQQAAARRLVVSIDVGTAFSSAAYTIQTPGKPVVIQDVTFPGKDGKCVKAPTVVVYSPDGEVLACGCEADAVKKKKGLSAVRWFKLHMCPASMGSPPVEIPPLTLPPELTATRVMAAFLRYMKRAVQQAVQKDNKGGDKLWDQLQHGISYILCHPNGWEGPQQTELRQAAVWAELIPDTPEGQSHLMLTSEGEASFHWCVNQGLVKPSNVDQESSRIVVVNVGGGIVDVSSFEPSGEDTHRFREASIARSTFAGSTFVNWLLQEKLTKRLDKPAISQAAGKAVERQVIYAFEGRFKSTYTEHAPSWPVEIPSSNMRDEELKELDIKSKIFKVAGDDIAESFERPCEAIVKGIQEQAQNEPNVVLSEDINYFHSSNVVARGAITSVLQSLIKERIAKNTYGIRVRYRYDESDAKHMKRADKTYQCEASGELILTDGFLKIVSEGEAVPEGHFFEIPVVGQVRANKERPYQVRLYRYLGSIKDVCFIDEDPGAFEPVCELSADAPADALDEQKRGDGELYWSVNMNVVLNLGLTELACHVEWTDDEKGKRKSFKGQTSNAKVPTILHYDDMGELLACGAESVEDLADGRDYMKVEWFKLLFGSKALDTSALGTRRPQLPPSRTLVDVLGDFLRYMNKAVEDHIRQTHEDGERLWSTLSEEATHPNGWEGSQQTRMREAAILGGLVPDTPKGRERVEFLTEGEASFHWCLDPEANLAIRKEFSVGDHIIVADAGGGTIDVSCYRVTSSSPLRLEEATEAQCEFAGSVFVTENFRSVAEEHFDGAHPDKDYVDQAVEDFDKRAKCLFADSKNPVFINIGGKKLTDADFGIRRGSLKLSGDTISDTFAPSCDGMVKAIAKQLSGRATATVYLVGGFAASPWLYSEVKRRIGVMHHEADVRRADSDTAKAAAHGAVSWYLNRLVTARVARHTFGTGCATRFDATDAEHRSKLDHVFIDDVTGLPFIGGLFKTIVQKGQAISEDATYRQTFVVDSKTRESVKSVMPLIRYDGSREGIHFLDDDLDSFEPAGFTLAEVPPEALVPCLGPRGLFWIASVEAVLILGKAEMKWYVEWEEEGVKNRSPASTIWAEP
ncbi:hypothetical protein FRB99_003524 [Tulasnella sp. 403]|nr:hypothetical protein FRB99_003524 [Tulasnella sp. 403]